MVTDPRPPDEVQAQQTAQKLIRKAFREAKAASLKRKERARAKRMQVVPVYLVMIMFKESGIRCLYCRLQERDFTVNGCG